GGDADVPGGNLDPAGVLHVVAVFRLHGLDDFGVEAVVVDPIPPRAERLAQRALVPGPVGAVQFAVHQELAGRQGFTHLARDDCDLARLHDDVGHAHPLPPDRAEEVPAGALHLLIHADFAGLGIAAGHALGRAE